MPQDKAATDPMMPSPQPQGLTKRILQGRAWGISGHALSQTVRLATNLAITRLLAPDMFGIMAVANLLMVSLTLLSDLGLRQNIVQSRHCDDPRLLATAWTVQVVRGLLLGGAALAGAGLLHLAQQGGHLGQAGVYGDPLLPPVIAWVAASAPLAGLQSIRVATAMRHLQQEKLLWIELAGQAAGIAVSLAWAWQAPAVWALVAGNLAAVAVSALASHVLLPGPSLRLAWDAAARAELLGFSRWILLSSAAGVLALGADRLFLGALADARLLGLYTIGQLVVTALENGVARLFVGASLPALGEAAPRERAELRALYYKFLKPFDFFLFFAAGFLLSGGENLVVLLYDPRYAEAGAILAVLALALPCLRFGLAYQIYPLLGQPRLTSLVGLVRLAALVALLPAGFWLGGFTGAVWAIALHGYATAPLVLYFNRQLGMTDFRRELRALPCFPLGLALGWLVLAPLGYLQGAAPPPG